MRHRRAGVGNRDLADDCLHKPGSLDGMVSGGKGLAGGSVMRFEQCPAGIDGLCLVAGAATMPSSRGGGSAIWVAGKVRVAVAVYESCVAIEPRSWLVVEIDLEISGRGVVLLTPSRERG